MDTPPISNIDTKNDGVENVSPFKHGYFGYSIYVKIKCWGCKLLVNAMVTPWKIKMLNTMSWRWMVQMIFLFNWVTCRFKMINFRGVTFCDWSSSLDNS